MEEQYQNIDDLFRQSLRDYREAPPSAAWDRLVAQLDADKEKTKRRFFLPWYWVFLAILIFAGAGWYMVAQQAKLQEQPKIAIAQDRVAISSKQTIDLAHQQTENKPPLAIEQKKNRPIASKPKISGGNRTATNQNLRAVKSEMSIAQKAKQFEHEAPQAQSRAKQSISNKRYPKDKSSQENSVQSHLQGVNKRTENLSDKVASTNASSQKQGGKIHPESSWDDQETAIQQNEEQLSKKQSLAKTHQLRTVFEQPLDALHVRDILAFDLGHRNSGLLTMSQIKPNASVAKTAQSQTFTASKSLKKKDAAPKPNKKQETNDTVEASRDKFLIEAAARQTSEQPRAENPQTEPRPTSSNKKKFSFAAQLGYEFPMASSGIPHYAAGGQLQWHFDTKFSLGTQLTIRLGKVSSRTLDNAKAYQQSSLVVDSVILTDSLGGVGYRQYNIREDFDSISVAAGGLSGTLIQVELPIIVAYNFAKNWRVYAGPTLNFGGTLNTTNGAIKHHQVVRTDTLRSGPGTLLPARPVSSFEGHFGVSALPEYNTYTPNNSTTVKASELRLGYLFGLGYDAGRLAVDVSMHRQVSGFASLPKPMQDLFSTTALRLSLGYYIIPRKGTNKKR
ncbi:MAG: hypothetical protein JST36_11120 [Bacteroidetes bacterium]|nr:hypothetical protein [Bacteroidota bacterium]